MITGWYLVREDHRYHVPWTAQRAVRVGHLLQGHNSLRTWHELRTLNEHHRCAQTQPQAWSHKYVTCAATSVCVRLIFFRRGGNHEDREDPNRQRISNWPQPHHKFREIDAWLINLRLFYISGAVNDAIAYANAPFAYII